MHIRVKVMLLSAGLGMMAVPAAAVTPNPTPNLKTGDYAAKWGILTVGDPSVYSRINVSANVYPTTVHYDAASGTYVVNDGQQDISFSRNEYVAATSSAAYTFYRDTSTGAMLRLLNQGPANPVIALTYVSYGKWSPKPQSPIVLNDNYVVFGSITAPSAVPRSGSASYNFIVDGTYQLNGSPVGSKTYALSGKGRLSADFAS